MRIIVVLLLFYSGVVNAVDGHPFCGQDTKKIENYICDSFDKKTPQLESEFKASCIPTIYKSVDSFIEARATYADQNDENCIDYVYDMSNLVLDAQKETKKEDKKKKALSNTEKNCTQSGCKQLSYIKTITSVVPIVGLYGHIAQQIQEHLREEMTPVLPAKAIDEQHCLECLNSNISNYSIESQESPDALKKLNDFIFEGVRKDIINRYMLVLEDKKLTDSNINPDDCVSDSKLKPYLNQHESSQLQSLGGNKPVNIHQCEDGRKITLNDYKKFNIELNTSSKSHIDDVIEKLNLFKDIQLSKNLSEKLFNKRRGVRADELLYLAADKSYINSLDPNEMGLSKSEKQSFDKFKMAAGQVSSKYDQADISVLMNTSILEDPNLKYLLYGPLDNITMSHNEGSIFNIYESIDPESNEKRLSKAVLDSINVHCESIRDDIHLLARISRVNNEDGIISSKNGTYEISSSFDNPRLSKVLSLAIDSYQKKNKAFNGLSYEKLGKLKCKSGESYTHTPANAHPFNSGLAFESSQALIGPELKDSNKRFFLNDYCKKPEYYQRNAVRISKYNEKWVQKNCSDNKCTPSTYQSRSHVEPAVSQSTSKIKAAQSVSKINDPGFNEVNSTGKSISGVSRLNTFRKIASTGSLEKVNKKISAINNSKESESPRASNRETSSLNKTGYSSKREEELEKQNEVLRERLSSLSKSASGKLPKATALKPGFNNQSTMGAINNSQARDFVNQKTSSIANYAKANVDKDSLNKNLANIRGNIREDKLEGVVSLVVDTSLNEKSTLEQIYEKLKDFDLGIIKEALDSKMPVKFVDDKGITIRIVEVDTKEYQLLVKRFNEISEVAKKEKPLNSTRLEYLNLIKASEELTNR